MTPNTQKYQDSILYLCQKLQGEIRGKKKLAKLLYFADFDFYEKNGRSITGATYLAFPMGPFPTDLEEITLEMERQNLIKVKSIEEHHGYIPTEIYQSIAAETDSALDEEEKKMLDRIVLKYGHLNGKQLEELSHAEAPYIGTEPQQEIPYELSYYRGTDFAES
jgi:uncharacterized phage-associated protein